MDKVSLSLQRLRDAHKLLGDCIDDMCVQLAHTREGLAVAQGTIRDMSSVIGQQKVAYSKLQARSNETAAPRDDTTALDSLLDRKEAPDVLSMSDTGLSSSESPLGDSIAEEEALLEKMAARKNQLKSIGNVDLRKEMIIAAARKTAGPAGLTGKK